MQRQAAHPSRACPDVFHSWESLLRAQVLAIACAGNRRRTQRAGRKPARVPASVLDHGSTMSCCVQVAVVEELPSATKLASYSVSVAGNVPG